jgi:hypothetical protein
MTKEQVSREIEKFLSDTGGAHDWDDFTSISIDGPELEKIRVFCADLPDGNRQINLPMEAAANDQNNSARR